MDNHKVSPSKENAFMEYFTNVLNSEEKCMIIIKFYSTLKLKKHILYYINEIYSVSQKNNRHLIRKNLRCALKNKMIDIEKMDLSIIKHEKILKIITHPKYHLAVSLSQEYNFCKIIPNLINITPKNLAEEMTNFCQSCFKKINVVDFVNVVVDDKYSSCAPLNDLIKHFEKISYLVPYEILKRDSIVEQIIITKKFVEVARLLREMKNYHSLMALLISLSNDNIQQIEYLWNKNLRGEYDKMINLISINKNYLNYRNEIKEITSDGGKIIPFVGLVLSDVKHYMEVEVYIKNKNKLTINEPIIQKMNTYINNIFDTIDSTRYNLHNDSYHYLSMINPLHSNIMIRDMFKQKMEEETKSKSKFSTLTIKNKISKKKSAVFSTLTSKKK